MKSSILVVDDDEKVLDILKKSLANRGHDVQVAGAGKEAIRLYKRNKPDVIILDMMLPDIDGKEVLRRLRKLEEGNGTPVLFLSANSDLDTRLEGLEEGAEDYLVKPFSLRELNKKVDKALERSIKTKELENRKKVLEKEILEEHEKYKELNKELKKQLLSMQTLFGISQDINKSLDTEELINVFALTIVGELRISSMAFFSLQSDKSKWFTLVGLKGLSREKIGDISIEREGEFARWMTKWQKPKKLVRNPDRRWVSKLPDIRLAIFEYATPIIVKQKLRGIVFTGPKLNRKEYTSFDLNILMSICNSAGISMENARLFKQLQSTYLSTVKTLVSIIEAKDAYTKGHTERVAEYASAIAAKMNLSREERKLIAFGAVLHDIGKLGVYENVLNKKENLSAEEWSILKSHPEVGASIIKNMEFLEGTVALVRHHHERYDGNGYPDRLRGEEIPLGARIITVADSFDAMITDRSYRKALSIEQAIATLEEKAGTQFDPVVVKNFVELIREGFLSTRSVKSGSTV